jgi:hypothetical protein
MWSGGRVETRTLCMFSFPGQRPESRLKKRQNSPASVSIPQPPSSRWGGKIYGINLNAALGPCMLDRATGKAGNDHLSIPCSDLALLCHYVM